VHKPFLELTDEEFTHGYDVKCGADTRRVGKISADPEGLAATSIDLVYDRLIALAAAIFNSGGGFVHKPFLELTDEEFTHGYESQG
jgi:hypothetical protein